MGMCDRRIKRFHTYHLTITSEVLPYNSIRFRFGIRVKGRKGNNEETNDETYDDANWISDAGGRAGVCVCAGG